MNENLVKWMKRSKIKLNSNKNYNRCYNKKNNINIEYHILNTFYEV
jgi:hypothetical protein